MKLTDEIRNSLSPLKTAPQAKLGAMTAQADIVSEYNSFFGLDPESYNPLITHINGTFESGSYTLASHLFVPENYKATIVCLHGYLSHVGQLKNLIKYFTANDYAVACFDLPGHGLSTGTAGGIDDFSEYSDALKVFTDIVTSELDGPYYLAGFSLGGAAVINSMLTDNNVYNYERFLLVAPLVRNFGWPLSNIAASFVRPISPAIPRIHVDTTSNRAFNYFHSHDDYLQLKELSLGWVRSLQKWNAAIVEYSPVKKTVLIIQGTRDTVVDYKYNINFLTKKLPDNKLVYIKGAGHELFNESEPMRKEAIQAMHWFIESN